MEQKENLSPIFGTTELIWMKFGIGYNFLLVELITSSKAIK